MGAGLSGTDVLRADRVDAAEAARLLGVDRNTVYRWAGRGKVRGYRVGRRLQFLVEDLAAAVEPVLLRTARVEPKATAKKVRDWVKEATADL
jgi:excisionase family DNA binding protein